MGRPATITRQWLEEHHVVDVTLDGHVYVRDRYGDIYECPNHPSKHATRYGILTYLKIGLYSKDERKRQLEAYKDSGTYASGIKDLCLHRLVWAWNYDGTNGHTSESTVGICPPYTCLGGIYDIHHIDDNSENCSFDNLEFCTHRENLAKRKGHMNQYEKSYKE